jgi:hypothetical protein
LSPGIGNRALVRFLAVGKIKVQLWPGNAYTTGSAKSLQLPVSFYPVLAVLSILRFDVFLQL